MDVNFKISANKICRTCLSESTDLRPLNAQATGCSTTPIAMLCFITNKNLAVFEEFPQQICTGCELILYQSDGFIRQCLKNEGILSNWFNGGDAKLKVKEDLTLDYNSDVNEPCKRPGCVHELSCSSNINDDVVSSKNSIGFPAVKDCLEEFDVKIEHNEYSTHDFLDNDTIDDTLLYKHETFKTEEHNTEEQKPSSEKTYKCVKCNCKFIDEMTLTNHTRQKHLKHTTNVRTRRNDKIKIECKRKNASSRLRGADEVKLLTCNECNRKFRNAGALKIHLKCKHSNVDQETTETVKLKYEIEISGDSINVATVNTELPENAISKESTPTEIYECSMCMRKFTQKNSLILHIKRHKEKANKTFTCVICKREFKHQAHLNNHIESVHAKIEAKLPKDIEMDNGTKKHSCKVCEKSFHMLSTLKDHIRVHTGEKPFLCSSCGRGFSQKTNLKEHMRRHQGVKPYKCENCDQKFVSKGELVAHNRKHTGAHPFICDLCNTGFTTSSSLVKHRRIHTGERPFACDLCPMRFAASGTLKNHVRTHTGEKPHHCVYCDKSFVQKNDLTSHIRCHTGERPYVCTTCGQAFRQCSALKTHLKIHSGKETTLLQTRKDVGLMGVQSGNALSMLAIPENDSNVTES